MQKNQWQAITSLGCKFKLGIKVKEHWMYILVNKTIGSSRESTRGGSIEAFKVQVFKVLLVGKEAVKDKCLCRT